jgi:hypothetical protein
MRYSFPWRSLFPVAVLCGVALVTPAAMAQSSQPAAQSPPAAPPQANGQQPATAAAQKQPAQDESRLFELAPSHNVGYEHNAATLTSRDKFRIFYQNTLDPFPFAEVAVHAGISQAEDTHRGFGEGWSGYGKRYGASLADSTSARFFCVFLFPSLFKQDPRYLRRSEGSFGSRVVYALSRPLITRADSGEAQFNVSNILGKFAASGLANAYYPPGNQGWGATASRVGAGIGYQSLGNLGVEFWPEIHRFIRKL